MILKRRGKIFVISVCCITLAGGLAACEARQAKDEPEKKVEQRTPTRDERITAVSRLLGKYNTLPSSLVDAQLEVKPNYDDRGWGPTDSTLYIYFKTAPGEINKWAPLLGDKTEMGTYYWKPKPYDWWIDEPRYKNSLHYDSMELLRLSGWVIVSRNTDEVWIAASRM